MSDFDERSGVVYCRVPWGQWGQTIEEVHLEVDVPVGTKSRDIQCEIKPRSISVVIHGKEVIKVREYGEQVCVCGGGGGGGGEEFR